MAHLYTKVCLGTQPDSAHLHLVVQQVALQPPLSAYSVHSSWLLCYLHVKKSTGHHVSKSLSCWFGWADKGMAPPCSHLVVHAALEKLESKYI